MCDTVPGKQNRERHGLAPTHNELVQLPISRRMEALCVGATPGDAGRRHASPFRIKDPPNSLRMNSEKL